MRKAVGVFVVMLLAVSLVTSVFVFAMPNTSRSQVTVLPSHNQVVVTIPERAEEVTEGIFDLGESVDPQTGKTVQGYAIFHHKSGHDGGPGGGGGEDTVSSCFAFIANGANWGSNEDYLVDPTNVDNLSEQFVSDNIALNIGKWETASGGQDIFGDEVEGDVEASTIGISSNGQNEVVFGDVDSSGAIAVTIVWGIFRGRPSNREIVEWDQVYDDVDFDWSSTGEAGKMDFENIANHEVGHAFGMGHPSNDCTEETMYAYASLGETKKRDLNDGDIAGILDLYA
jgi:hypothetical protein